MDKDAGQGDAAEVGEWVRVVQGPIARQFLSRKNPRSMVLQFA
jgi:hypothetical protein